MTLTLINQITQMLLCVIFGFILKRTNLITNEQSKGLSIISIYLALPCAILNSLQRPYTPDVLVGVAYSFIIILLIHVVDLCLYFIMRKVFNYTPLEGICMIYPNCGNMIIPLIMAVLGDEYVIYICPYIFIQNIFIWTHGISAVTGKPTYRIKTALANPVIIAAIAGLALFTMNVQLPPILAGVCSQLAGLTAPLAMIVAGVLLGEMNFDEIRHLRRLPLMIFTRLLIVPIVLILAVTGMRLVAEGFIPSYIFYICLLGSTAPTASTLVQISQLFSDQAKYVSCIHSLALLVSIFTIPTIMFLYELI